MKAGGHMRPSGHLLDSSVLKLTCYVMQEQCFTFISVYTKNSIALI